MSEEPKPNPLLSHVAAELLDARRYERLVESIRDYAIYLLDVNGTVVSWNMGAQRFKGYTADEIIGQHFSRFYTPEDRARGLPAHALRVAAEEGKFEAEGWRMRKDGTRFWTSVVIDPVYRETGELIGFAKVTRDIGAKKAARDALFASEQRFSILVQGVKDYAIYMLDPDGYVSNWNTGAEAIKGYSVDEIVGQHFSRFYTEEDRARGEPARTLATALREGKYQSEGWRVRKDGSRFWAMVVVDPIFDEHGGFVGYAKVTRDNTELRQAQLELERSREALSQAQKMEAIGRLTGGVAHDFNNLLTIIRSSAELLRRPGLSQEKRDKFVEAIADTATKAAQLTRQLLAFARKQPLRPEAFSVAARLRGLEHLIRSTVGNAVPVTLDVAEELAAVQADPSQFDAVILILVINARDAMPDGGTLRISARTVTAIPPVRQHAGACGQFVAVSVTDSGTGISPDVVNSIFEPFFPTKPVKKGTGLGLSQAYGFAKQSGGEIDVDTQLGRGTTFTLYLPRAQTEPKSEPAPAGPSAPLGLPAKLRVLLVEDNETVGGFAAGLLQDIGADVRWVTDGQLALAALAERHGEFDLVFSDIVMPGMNGVELAREVRQRWPAVRVVLTSGYSHNLAEGGVEGFDFLEKPYSTERLLSLLRKDGAERV